VGCGNFYNPFDGADVVKAGDVNQVVGTQIQQSTAVGSHLSVPGLALIRVCGFIIATLRLSIQ
jgi:hypothetical protein